MTEIWGIVNVTPDSFSDGGRHSDPTSALAHARLLLAQGAHVLDIGGESTRPGAERVPHDVEQQRVIGVIEALTADGAVTSIDTMNASTAVAAVRAGARYVNDVAGGLADPDMLAAVAETDATYVVGHWRGPSSDMYARADYTDAAREVAIELGERVSAARAVGIGADRLMVDPGIGFAKTAEQSWDVLRGLDEIIALGYPVLIGTSRKRFFTSALGDDLDESRRDLATALTSAMAADAGASAVRVHNVPATRDALAVRAAWKGNRHG